RSASSVGSWPAAPVAVQVLGDFRERFSTRLQTLIAWLSPYAWGVDLPPLGGGEGPGHTAMDYYEGGSFSEIALRQLQRQLYEPVGPLLAVEIAAGRDDVFELRCRDWQARDNIANAARLLGEVPHELTPGGLLRVAPAILSEDRDAR